MKYRADIDGLRSIAVLPVILFHAGFSVFSGGFVGVDIFFVISGFLITTIILSEMELGKFSIITFYERRARRILPALFLIMGLSVLFAWFLLPPSEMKSFAKSLIAVPTFSSNILFWSETGYWGTENELKPLLHTWSLAVEEQYYVLFPLFLMLLWRLRKRWILGSFIVICILSFISSQIGLNHYPTANFFLLPTRAWELGIGACIAFYMLYRPDNGDRFHPLTSQVFSFLGLALITYSIFIFDETTAFPGANALIPTIGTGLIILFSHPHTVVNKMLSSKAPVFIGLISYSAYLWHQPIFAFARHYSLTEPSHLQFTFLSILSLILAYVSWKFIEAPFRDKKVWDRKAIFTFSAVGSLCFIIIGFFGYLTNGFKDMPLRDNDPQSKNTKVRLKVNYGLDDSCEQKKGEFKTNCKTKADVEMLLWGDSYSMHLALGITASNPKVGLMQLTKSACGPLFNAAPITNKLTIEFASDCLAFTKEVKNWIALNENKEKIKHVVISSPFHQYIGPDSKLLYRNGRIEKSNVSKLQAALLETLAEIKTLGLEPILISPPAATGENLGACLAKAQWQGRNLSGCDFSPAQMSQERLAIYAMLEKIAQEYKVIRLDDYTCANTTCKVSINDVWIYRDKGHLSIEGSQWLGKYANFYQLITDTKQLK